MRSLAAAPVVLPLLLASPVEAQSVQTGGSTEGRPSEGEARSGTGGGTDGSGDRRGSSTAQPRSPYAGVVPGRGHAPPNVEAARKGPARVLTWPGLQMRPDGASRFFLQTSESVQTETKKSEGRFEVLLEDTKVSLRNNLRPLETRFFNTPVTRAQVKRRGGDVAFVLELRRSVEPVVRSEEADNGLHYVFVEFPPGDHGPDASAAKEDRGGGSSEEGASRDASQRRNGSGRSNAQSEPNKREAPSPPAAEEGPERPPILQQ